MNCFGLFGYRPNESDARTLTSLRYRYELVDVIMEVLDQLGATEVHPIHRSKFNPIIERRWKELGNVLDPNKDFGQTISAESLPQGGGVLQPGFETLGWAYSSGQL
jgi:hypothetical protein